MGPEFFANVFAASYTPVVMDETAIAVMNAREVCLSDDALAARWAQAREASRLLTYLREDVLHLILGAFGEVRQAFGRLSFLGPLRTVPERYFERRQPQDGRWQASGGSAWDLLRDQGDIRKRVNTWMATKLGMGYEVRARRLFDEAQLEYTADEAGHLGLQTAAAWLTAYLPEAMQASGIAPEQIARVWDYVRQDVERQSHRPEQRGRLRTLERTLAEQMPEALVRDQNWLTDAGPEPHWRVSTIIKAARTAAYIQQRFGPEQPLPVAEELSLFDVRGGVNVGAREVGLGVSQVLPVLVNAAAGEGQTVLVEQPELHLHPALQAELADVFVEAVHDQRHSFVLETHSEHLILRLLRRIRETTDAEGDQEAALRLTVNDLAVLYARPGEEGTRIEEVEITPDGDFLHHWPPGFFADRSRELF